MTNRGMKTLLYSFCFLFMACTSMTERGDELYEAGDYAGAMKYYEKALAKDPDETDAHIGLKKARIKWIDESLIRVRQLRLANNFDDAIAQLEQVMNNESSWKLSPPGASFNTQQDESDYLARYIGKRVESNIKNYPIVANMELRRYQQFFEGAKRNKQYNRLRKKTQASGDKACSVYSALPTKGFPYYSEFTKKYCAYWGKNVDGQTLTTSYRNVAESFGSIKLTGQIEGLKKGKLALIESHIEKGFKQSPWFNPTSTKPLVVRVTGQFVHKYSRQPSIVMEDYTVQIPYTAYETRQESYQEPYESTEHVYNIATGKTELKTVTKYRTAYRPKQVKVTRFRTEGRTQEVMGHSYQQSLLLAGNFHTRALGDKIVIPIKKQDFASGLSHDASMPSLQIYPRPEKTYKPLEWVERTFSVIPNQFSSHLSESWVKTFCKARLRGKTVQEFINSSVRCMKSRTARSNGEIDNWFRKNHGLNFKSFSLEMEKESPSEGSAAVAHSS